MSTTLRAGRFTAKVTDYSLTAKNDDDPGTVQLRFEWDDEKTKNQYNWFGSLKENSLKYTVEALLAAGYIGDDNLIALGDESKFPFDPAVTCEIQCEFETYEGKERFKIKWVNKAGGGMKNKMSTTDIKKRTAGLGLAALFAEKRGGNTASSASVDNIPF